MKGEDFFDDLFYQNWAFFAPPPTADNKLYYRFELLSDTSMVRTFEALGPIIEMKREAAPFNANQEILEYILSGTVHNITDGLYSVNRSIDFGSQFTSDSSNSDEDLVAKKFNLGKEYVQESNNFITLKNYALLVANRQGLKISEYAVNIYITEVSIPRFSNRDELEFYSSREEKIIFYSDKFTY